MQSSGGGGVLDLARGYKGRRSWQEMDIRLPLRPALLDHPSDDLATMPPKQRPEKVTLRRLTTSEVAYLKTKKSAYRGATRSGRITLRTECTNHILNGRGLALDNALAVEHFGLVRRIYSPSVTTCSSDVIFRR